MELSKLYTRLCILSQKDVSDWKIAFFLSNLNILFMLFRSMKTGTLIYFAKG
jgi:hypothetical protein